MRYLQRGPRSAFATLMLCLYVRGYISIIVLDMRAARRTVPWSGAPRATEATMLYLSFISVDSLTASLFLTLLAAALLRGARRGTARFHLGMVFSFEVLHNISFFFKFGLYSPIGAWATLAGVAGTLWAMTHTVLFVASYPRPLSRRLVWWFTVLAYCVNGITVALNAVEVLGGPAAYTFDGHHFTPVNTRFYTLFMLVTVVYIALFTGIGIVRAVRNKGQHRLALVSFTLLFVAISLAPAILNFQRIAGALSHDTFFTLWFHIATIGWFFVGTYYLNTTDEEVPLLLRFIGIAAASFCVFMLFGNSRMRALSYESHRQVYVNSAQAEIALGGSALDRPVFIRAHPSDVACPAGQEQFLQEGDSRYIVFCVQQAGKEALDVGFDYLSYRAFMHHRARWLVLLVLIGFAGISAGSWLFFLGALVLPLRTLIDALRRVGDGDLEVRVGARWADEIGFVSRAFNDMVVRLKRTEEERAAADSASRAKSEFLSNMSHELRTPLNAILGFTQTILRDSRSLTSAHRDGLLTVKRSGRHLQTLIDDMFDLARIEARKLELTPAAFSLLPMVKGVVGMVSERADQKKLRLDLDISGLDSGVRVHADERRLSQVLINLLTNAIKFTDEGSVSLQVSRIESDQPSGSPGSSIRVGFVVTDTGIGISAEDQAKVFEPFEQIGDAESRSKGVGLGLAISRRIAEMMGGELTVESVPGEGSRFFFDVDLPTVHGHDGAQARLGASAQGYRGPRRTVLVVDDNAENRAVVRGMIEPLGFVVDEAVDGRDGLEHARQTRPDVIVTDLLMAGMSGTALVRQVASSPELEGIPVFVTSASPTDENIAATREAGAAGFFGKPIDVDVFLNRLGEALGIEWECRPVGDESEAVEETDFVPPSPEALEGLEVLLNRGDMRNLLAAADRLERNNHELGQFAAQLRKQCEAYNERGITRLLKRCREALRGRTQDSDDPQSD